MAMTYKLPRRCKGMISLYEYRRSLQRPDWIETRLLRDGGQPMSGIWYNISEEHWQEFAASNPAELAAMLREPSTVTMQPNRTNDEPEAGTQVNPDLCPTGGILCPGCANCK